MKFLILVMILMMTVGCGKQTKTIIIEGKPGQDGKDGTNGKDGSSCSVARAYDASGEFSIGVTISCTDGSSELVLNGLNGQTGATGAQGIQGVPGSSCSVARKAGDNYVTVSCPQQTDVVIYDGLEGQQGLKGDKGDQGQTGATGQAGTSVSVLYPCGKGTHTEIFLKLSTGEIVAVYDGGPNDDRLTLLIQGVTYTTTDRDTKKNCLFKLDSNNNIIKL
jgi:hypothetical protein